MNKLAIALSLILFITLSCSKEDKNKPKNIKTIHFNKNKPLFEYSLPPNSKAIKHPLVLFVGPGLFLPEKRTYRGNNYNFFTSYDFYFNNNKIAVGRFTKLRTPLNFQKSVKNLKSFFNNVEVKKSFSHIFIVTFGEASFLLPQLLKDKRIKASILIGPLLGSVHKAYYWKIYEEPFNHFKTCFDYNGDNKISLKEFAQDIYHDKEGEYTNKEFVDFDINKDNTVNQADFSLKNREKFTSFTNQQVRQTDNPTWIQSIRDNKLELNKLNCPIFIYHGQTDREINWQTTERLVPKNKNIKFEIVPGHDNLMNWKDAAIYRKMSAGMMAIINTVFELEKKLK